MEPKIPFWVTLGRNFINNIAFFEISTFKFFQNALKTLGFGQISFAATSKMERFVIIVNGWKPLISVTLGL